MNAIYLLKTGSTTKPNRFLTMACRAMSAGCLILASVYAGASEAFVEDVSGFSLNPGNPEKWSSILEEFWASPQSFVLTRKRAMKHAMEAFDIRKTVSSLYGAIEGSVER